MQIRLTDSEWKIMNLLWDHGKLTIAQIVQALYTDTAWSKHTVISFLNRLEAKQAVAFDREDGAKAYYPLLDRRTAALHDTQDMLDKVFQGSLPKLVNTFAGKGTLTPEEIAELETILRKLDESEPAADDSAETADEGGSDD